MHKQFQEDRYLYWSVMGAILQVRLVRTASHKLTSPIPRLVIRQQLQA